jgi:VanZ family protein
MSQKLRSLAPWLLVGLVMLVMYSFSAQPNSGEFTAQFFGHYNHLVRKIAHFSEYAVLFLVSTFAFRRLWSNLSAGWIALVCLALCVAFAAGDEFHQSFVPGRTPLVSDVLLDSFGALFAGFLWLAWRTIRTGVR